MLALATSPRDMRERLGRMVIGNSNAGASIVYTVTGSSNAGASWCICCAVLGLCQGECFIIDEGAATSLGDIRDWLGIAIGNIVIGNSYAGAP